MAFLNHRPRRRRKLHCERRCRFEGLELRRVLNATPVLDPTVSLELASIGEDATAPVGEVGTLVSSLIDAGGVLDNYADADGDAPAIAITGTNPGDGTLWVSINGGVTWEELGEVGSTSPRLLVANTLTRLYYEPPAVFTAAIDDVISFRAWDQTGELLQFGGDIDGEAPGDQSGSAVALSADGQTLVVGAVNNSDNGNQAGHVRVYRLVGYRWEQVGSDIDGEHPKDNAGFAVAVSADGQTVAVGAPKNSDQGEAAGQVRVYCWNGVVWEQRGSDLDGDSAGDLFGSSVALSADGETVFVGAPRYDGSGEDSGLVRRYRWINSTWKQVGADLIGAAPSASPIVGGDRFGTSIAVRADGDGVLIGAPLHDLGGADAGHVRLRAWSGWWWINQKEIAGEAANDYSGGAVALSADGKTIAIGAIGNDGGGFIAGHVRVYRLTSDGFVQLGADIDGEAASDLSGGAVSLSADGDTLAIGATGNDGNGGLSGQVRLYRWTGVAWQQVGDDIDGEAAGDGFGNAVSLSADGRTLAAGATSNGDAGIDAGHVRVYRFVPKVSSLSAAEATVRVAPLNSAPVLDTTASPELLATDEGSPVPVGLVGTPVSALIDVDGVLANFHDADGDAPGIAITGTNLQGGALWYSVDAGTTWEPLGEVSENAARLLSAADSSRLYYQPVPGFTGTISDVISFKAWDQYVLHTPLGVAIDGEAAGDLSGTSVSLSADGQTIAIGAPGNETDGTGGGHVRVYDWNGATWAQRGADIDAPIATVSTGGMVNLSADGQTLVVGSYGRVLRWNGTEWEGIGGFGTSKKSVALSADGLTVAMGWNIGTLDHRGIVKIYRWTGSGWGELGQDLHGEATGDYSGDAVALSADGEVVAIGAPVNDGAADGAGHVRVYRLNDDVWEQVGADLDGERILDHNGAAVALSADGRTLAIGADWSSTAEFRVGKVRVFRWSGSEWIQQGTSIFGETSNDQSGAAISLSADGRTLVIGARFNEGGFTALNNNAGHARVYRWTEVGWKQVGTDIDGDALGDQFGTSVAVSADGLTVAAGAPCHDGSGDDAGRVRVYRLVPGQTSLSLATETVAVTVVPVNRAPTGVELINTQTVVAENTDTSQPLRVAEIVVTDDGLGTNVLSLSGADANVFELNGSELFLKAGVVLDYETQASYAVTVQAFDATVDGSSPVSAAFSVEIADVNEAATAVDLVGLTSTLAENTDTTTRLQVATIIVSDDALGTNVLTVSGADAGSFEIVDGRLFIRAGVVLDYETQASYSVRVTAADEALLPSVPVSVDYVLQLTDVVEMPFESVMTLASNGTWYLGRSDGDRFEMSVYGIWNMNVEWTSILHGDVNGDGLMDIIGRTHIGQWWATLNQGDGTGGGNVFLGYWKADMGFSDVVCVDINGDGRDDVAGRTPSGQWWVGLSQGDSLGFTNQRLARWTSAAVWAEVLVGDFNGDGRDDIAGLADSGIWWSVLGHEDGTGDVAAMGVWSPDLGFTDITTGDFNGDGKTDIVGRSSNGQWWTAMAKADVVGFDNELIGGWSTRTEWTSVASGDFNGDGSTDIVGRASNGQWWGLMSDGSGELRTNTLVGYWSRRVNWTGIITGDADGDGRDDIIGRVATAENAARGRIWVGFVGPGMMESEAWGFVGAPTDAEARTVFFARF